MSEQGKYALSGSESVCVPADDTDTRKSRILVIDDDPDIRATISRTVRRAGCEPVELADHFRIPTVIDVDPVLIILDVTLKNSDAVDVLHALSAVRYNGPVLLLSGVGGELLEEIKGIGCRKGMAMLPPVRKPFRVRELAEIVDDVISSSILPSAQTAGNEPALELPNVNISQALEKGWLQVWYQLKYEVDTGRINGAECLSRIVHPEAGVLPPASFLPQATADEITALTRFVLRQAFRDRKEYAVAGIGARLAVNVPVQMVTGASIVGLLRECASDEDDWRGLILEITEEEALHNLDLARDAGTQLRIYGVSLSIDDFGTGYSSLARLRDLPFSEIKVDRSLVDGVSEDPTKAAMCRMVVDLAHALNASAVAEGVERVEDLEYLQAIGCDLVQGFLLGRPMPKSQILELAMAGR